MHVYDILPQKKRNNKFEYAFAVRDETTRIKKYNTAHNVELRKCFNFQV